jgi:hypothetical protein
MLQGCVLYELRTPTQEKLGVFAGYEDAFRVALTQHSDRPAVEVWRTFNIDRSERYVTVLFPMIEAAAVKARYNNAFAELDRLGCSE